MTNQQTLEIIAARKARRKAAAHLRIGNAAANEANKLRFEAAAALNPARFEPKPKDGIAWVKNDYYGDRARQER